MTFETWEKEDTNMSTTETVNRDFTPTELRAAAERFATKDATERLQVAPLPKRALAAIFEQAFPEAPLRGPTYSEEREELCRWLTSWANVETSELDNAPLMLATVVACMGDRWDADSQAESIAEAVASGDTRLAEGLRANMPHVRRRDEALLDLVRSVAIYFLRMESDTMADLLREDEIDQDGDEDEKTEPGGAS
jgi:hypothetical protein